MSSPEAGAMPGSRSWLVFLARAVIAIVVALAVTFSADHSTLVGALSFGVFAILSGVAIGIGAVVAPLPGTGLAQGIVSVVAGLLAIVVARDEIAVLLFIVGAWAVLTAVLEFVRGLRVRGRSTIAREWLAAGVITAVFAVAVLLVPSDFTQGFVGPDGVARTLTASVFLTGLTGAYAAILGVYLVIAALSMRWSASPKAVAEVAR